MPIDVRAITDDEFSDFNRAEHFVFGDVPLDDKDEQRERAVAEIDRCLAAFDDGHVVATAAAYTMGMTVPGGAEVAVAGVTAVTVAPTHRRQGLLRRLMDVQLDDVVARGEPIAILNASEAGIYGRFGYGLASLYQSWRIETARADFLDPVDPSLRLRLVPKNEAAPIIQPIFERWRRTRPGAVTQSDAWWGAILGDEPGWKGGGKVFVVVCEPDGSHDGGYALYTIDNQHRPGYWKLDVIEIVALDPRVEARLWRYLLDVDLVDSVTAQFRPLDDPLRWRLADPRQVLVTGERDWLFVRLLDVAAALSARRYQVDDALVIEVADPFRPAVAGHYRVAGGPDGVQAAKVGPDVAADLTMDIRELGSLYLGGVWARDLAAADRVIERTPGALARADAFFRWPVEPFSATRF